MKATPVISQLPLAKPGLSETLSVILPTEEQTWLLRACLFSGRPGCQAWEVWQERVGDLMPWARANSPGIKGLLPLLFRSLRRNRVDLDDGLLSYLRTAYLQEHLRSNAYRRICRTVLSAFASARISTIVLGGAALADTVYGDPALRHSHDIDMLLAETDLSPAARLLPSLGFTPLREGIGPEWQDVTLEHTSGLPLALHRHLFRIPFYNGTRAEMWARSQFRVIAGIPSRVLSPADNLLHICGHAFYSRSRQWLRWVCDSWLIIDESENLDWEVLLDCARRSHLALPLSVTLGYLAEKLQAPIPPIVLERLYDTASQANGIERDTALAGARASTPDGLRRLLRMTGDWRARTRLVRWLLLPSAGYLRQVYRVRAWWLLPVYYFYRPLRYGADRVRSYSRRFCWTA